jgi:hypothetical protein
LSTGTTWTEDIARAFDEERKRFVLIEIWVSKKNALYEKYERRTRKRLLTAVLFPLYEGAETTPLGLCPHRYIPELGGLKKVPPSDYLKRPSGGLKYRQGGSDYATTKNI